MRKRSLVMRRRCCLLLLLLCVTAASQTDESSRLEGFVTTDVATVLPNATIGVDRVTRGFHRRAVTDTSGYYIIAEIEPGAYSVWAEVDGLGCIVYPRVAIYAGQRLRRDFHFARAKRYPGSCEPLQKKTK